MDFSGVKDVVGYKVGGVPVGLVGALVFVIGVSWYMRKNNTDTTVTDATGDNSADPTVTLGTFSANTADITTSQNNAESTGASVDTVDVWTRNAIAWLVTNKNYGTSQATAAVQAYLDSDSVDFQTRQDLDTMLKAIGLPPVIPGAGGTSVKPSAPASKQGEPPVTHTVKGSNDNTFPKLAVLYYGTSNADYVNAIRARNTAISGLGGTSIPVNTRVNIPAYKQPRYYVATAAVNTAYAIAARNSTTPAALFQLNPGVKFPVKAKTRVRVA
jgi:LysM repeat protein